MVAKQSVNKVLGKVVVRAESVPSEGGFKNLHRVERDADIDAVAWLSIGTDRRMTMMSTLEVLSFVI